MLTIFFWLAAIVVAVFALTVFLGAPYVPSHRKQIDFALTELYKLRKSDCLVDIGSGDGIVMRRALEKGAGRAVGYEINPFLALLSWALGVKYKKTNHKNKYQTRLANFWTAKIPDDTTVCYVFGDGRDIDKIAKKVQKETNRLGRKLFLISYGFETSKTKGVKLVKAAGPFFLYEFLPTTTLQPQKT